MLINKNFPLPLHVKFIDGEVWEVLEPFEYVTKSDETIHVPAGFLTDMASIPRIFQPIIGDPTGRYGPSAIIHDWLYYKKIYKRSKADKIFYEAMGVLGVPNWKRSIMYMAVRLCAWLSWNNRKPLIVIILFLFCLSGCASYNPKTKTMWSLFGGRYKDKDVEFEAYPPIKDLISINALRTP